MNRRNLYSDIKTHLLKNNIVDDLVKREVLSKDNKFISDFVTELVRHRNLMNRIVEYVRENYNVLEKLD